MSDFAHLEIPGPTVTQLTRPFWDAAAEGKLLIQRCNGCDESIFYPRPICPKCWSSDLEWTQASGRGTIKSFSQIWKPGHPGWLPVAPYYVGLVELTEGPTMLSHILTNDDDVEVGSAVEFAPTQAGKHILPFFKIQKKTRSDQT